MPFNRSDMARVASASTGAHAMWLYLTPDTLEEVLAPGYFSTAYVDLRVNDVISLKYAVGYQYLSVTASDKNGVSVIQTDFITPTAEQGLMNWRGEWNGGIEYKKNDVVIDSGWLMVANKLTFERAAPQPVGENFYLYDGTLAPDGALAKQVIFGTRYTFTQNGYINGYRIETVAGNRYQVYGVTDPNTNPVITLLFDFIAAIDGWTEFSVTTRFIQIGALFDLVVYVQEPDPTPTTFNGNWNYTTPNNTGTPPTGTIIHANKELASFRINKIDDDGIDHGGDLEDLLIGDIIEGAGVRWSIQSITDQGSWVDINVAPAAQGGPDGVQNFIFETIATTPISYGEDVDYWLSVPGAQGLLGIDTPYPDIVPNDNAYGADLLVQQASIPSDWDFVALSSLSALSQTGATEVRRVLTAFSLASQAPTGTDNPEPIEFGAAQGGPGSTVQIDAAGVTTFNVSGIYRVRVVLSISRTTSPGVAYFFFRGLFNGVQVGNPVACVMTDDDMTVPLEYSFTGSLTAGTTMNFEMVRDSLGVNGGGLNSFPSSVGWGDSPSASLSIDKLG